MTLKSSFDFRAAAGPSDVALAIDLPAEGSAFSKRLFASVQTIYAIDELIG